MKAGRMDRIITIKEATTDQSSQGQERETWAQFHRCFAEWVPMMASERFKADAQHTYLTGRFRLRYKAGILTTMQLECEGQLYKITGIAEITRREGIELAVEAWQ